LFDKEYLNQLLRDKKRLLTQTYFDLQRYFEKLYGPDVVVLMEVGSFFEVYEVNTPDLQVGKAKEVAELLNIQLTRKNKTIPEVSMANPLMAGVPSFALERYLDRLVQSGCYTIVLIRQKGEPPKIERYLANIISPGTNFDYHDKPGENYIVSLIIGQNKERYYAGYAAVDVTTGRCFVGEFHSTNEDRTYALDELFSLLRSFETSEVLLDFEGEVDEEFVFSYLELDSYVCHQNDYRPKIAYQNELFAKVFDIHSILSPIEYLDLERYPYATQTLAKLLDFIIDHDSAIVEKLSRPVILGDKRFVYLGNNALEQLGVISKDPGEMTLLKLLDFTSTPMGKRLLKERLLNPIQDPQELERRYDMIERFLDHFALFQSHLRQVYDIERILRRIKLKKAHPYEMNYLHTSLFAIERIFAEALELGIQFDGCSLEEIEQFRKSLERIFDLDRCGRYRQDQIDANIFNEGIKSRIDAIDSQIRANMQKLHKIRDEVARLFESDEGQVSIGWMESEGYYLGLTRTRFAQIEKALAQLVFRVDDRHHSGVEFGIRRLKNSVKLTSPMIDEISKEIASLQTRLVALVKEEFLATLERLEMERSALLERLIAFVAQIDWAISGAVCAKRFNYTRPQIVESKTLEFVALRHPLIESREENGIYIPNDLLLGDPAGTGHDHVTLEASGGKPVRGVLLYGINSSGKSSLMKSVGLAVIMAQSGLFVPAASMRYSLIDKLFTRIVSKDNLYKGLSTFAVEMLELKNIFNRASEKSLVLGDEVSHGTETYSALSIVSAAIRRLDEIGAYFIFATHLHQLVDMEEIKSLKGLVYLHLGVRYDEENDRLIYDRKLAVGSGSTMYGLEFAKALHMDEKFLRYAFETRKRLTKDHSEIELLRQKKRSRYNKKLYLTKCAICNEAVEEVHHIAPKAQARSGFIDHFKANHRYNLIPLCAKHHKMVHEGRLIINGFVMSEEGLKLHYTEKES